MKSWASETRAAYSSSCRLFPVLLLLLMLAPVPSQAFTLADTRGIGARAMAMGGAFTAVADDPSANYYNPAGLVQVNLHDLQIEYLMAFPRVYVQRGSGPREVYLDKEAKAPMFGIILDVSRHWKLPKRVRLGFSSYFPQNLKSAGQIRYGTFYDPYFPRYGDSSADQTLAAWVNGGLEIFSWLYVGGGFSFGTHASDVTLSMAIDPGNLQLVMERSGVVWKMSTEISPIFGVLIKPLHRLRIGFTYREGMKLLFSGGLKVEADLLVNGQLRPFPIPGFPIVVPINSHYRPLQFALGTSYQLAENLLVAFDLTCYDWRGYQDEAEQPLNPEMQAVIAPRFGAEYLLRKNLALRAGYGYSPSPLKQQVGTWVNYLDNDLHVFSIGAEYAWDVFGYLQDRPLQFSFCYQFSYLTPRTFFNVYPGAPPLRSSGYVQCVGFGMQMIF